MSTFLLFLAPAQQQHGESSISRETMGEETFSFWRFQLRDYARKNRPEEWEFWNTLKIALKRWSLIIRSFNYFVHSCIKTNNTSKMNGELHPSVEHSSVEWKSFSRTGNWVEVCNQRQWFSALKLTGMREKFDDSWKNCRLNRELASMLRMKLLISFYRKLIRTEREKKLKALLTFFFGSDLLNRCGTFHSPLLSLSAWASRTLNSQSSTRWRHNSTTEH